LEAEEIINVEGKSCPMPLFLTKKALNKIESNKILQVIGDFLPAKENITEFLENEGHQILSVKEKSDPYQFIILIKKA